MLRRLSDLAWRLLVIAAALLAVIWVLQKVGLVVLALYFALLIAAVVVPVVRRLEDRGMRTLVATWIGFGGLLAIVGGVMALIVPVVIDEFEDFPTVIEQGINDIEDWLVQGPIGLDRDDVDEYRSTLTDYGAEFLRSSSGGIIDGILAVFEGLAGILLALILAFFLIKDGRRFQRWSLDRLPPRHQDLSRALASRSWDALGGYLRGAALLGIVEAIAIGVTLWLVGATLIIPVMLITFLGAFVPLVGAVVAGVLATLVALVSGGPTDALIVGLVAITVQQFDADLLAPWIYGRMISLHPAVILLVIASGGALAGLAGAFLAVPLAAVIAAVSAELWSRYGEEWRQRA